MQQVFWCSLFRMCNICSRMSKISRPITLWQCSSRSYGNTAENEHMPAHAHTHTRFLFQLCLHPLCLHLKLVEMYMHTQSPRFRILCLPQLAVWSIRRRRLPSVQTDPHREKMAGTLKKKTHTHTKHARLNFRIWKLHPERSGHNQPLLLLQSPAQSTPCPFSRL